MGSSSKKHKKEKKKKHKSRSRSPLEPGVERERKHHRKHKKRDRSPEVEEVPVDSHLAASNGDAIKERSREEHARERQAREEQTKEPASREDYVYGKDTSRSAREEHRESRDDFLRERSKETSSREKPREDSLRDRPGARAEKSPPLATNNSDSLSIEDTNRIRAKLGLKPLQVEEKKADDGKITDDLGEFYHAPAANISEQRRTEKLKQKLHERKEKRQLEQRFLTSSLADGSDDEDAAAWVTKSRVITKQKEDAAKRAAMLDEMDAVFGVSELVEEETREERGRSYTAQQLKGLRVAHDTDNLVEGREVVLTLADKNLLDDDAEDVLINVNMVDDDKYRKNVEDRKKASSGYQAYEDADDIEAAAMGAIRPVLAKYDEEIEQGAASKAKGFLIGDEDAAEAKRFRQMMVKARLAGEAGGKRLESLRLPELQIASDYLSEAELNAKFKKPKRKGKMRKKAKAEPIDVDEYDPSNAPLETDDTDVTPAELKMETEVDEELEPDSELQVALARARRLRQVEQLRPKGPKVEELLNRVKVEAAEEAAAEEAAGERAGGDDFMVLDATAEFCRTLGDIPTYGLAGNRDSHLEMMDYEREEAVAEAEEAEATGAWSRVDVGAEKPADIAAASAALEAEPALGTGVGGALKLALSKGYLERQEGAAPRASNTHHLLMARHYSIDDKAHGEEDKFSRRGQERYSGPLQDFREKGNFKPNVKLDYVDDEGRPLCPKEAFRYLSHKFHGKGPGKNKQEKRIKKSVQEGLMKKMSSTDTPLGTLAMLQGKQKETQSAYVVLSGTKREPNH